ncbi:hypothetical protein PWT90_00735 [Aphanocladium album]|nr:hypothetical protein PWT90_00735 [Aphanocladium album]
MNACANLAQRLALELQLVCVRSAKSQQKGKGRAGEPNDFEVALEEQERLLILAIQSFHDWELARRFASHYSAGQNASRRPWPPAPTPSAGPSRQTKPSAASGSKSKHRATPERSKFKIIYEDGTTIGQTAANEAWFPPIVTFPDLIPPSSGKAPLNSVPLKAKTSGKEAHHLPALCCVGCGEIQDRKSATLAPCGDAYCPTCLSHIFNTATTNESRFPPQCCGQTIPLEAASKWLSKELLARFKEKQVEFTIPNRLYCSNGHCSRFIPPSKIVGHEGYCETCMRLTCEHCKLEAHTGLCSMDPSQQLLRSLAQENDWMDCYNCGTLVDLAYGCNHVSK